MHRVLRAGFWLLPLAGCVTAPRVPPPTPPAPALISKANALQKLAPNEVPAFQDDFDAASLAAAALHSATYFRRLPATQAFIIAGDTYTARDLAESSEAFAALVSSGSATGSWLPRVAQEFTVYQSVGTDANRSVTFSSYYEPTIPAQPRPGGEYLYPLYARPPELIDVDLGAFDPALQGHRISGRREGRTLVPYHTRAEIDSRKRLASQRLELAWAKNPLDIFFLQVEGSGWLDMGDGTTWRIRYDGDNGRKYKSVGQYLLSSGRIKGKGLSHAKFKEFMDSHPDERQEYLNVNERYIFFRIDRSTAAAYALGNIQVPLTPGRSVATDPRLFPKGLLAWVSIRDVVSPAGPKPLERFVLNQDEGGAILGPGRVDFFAGHGPDAEQFAFQLWNPGKLYFLVKKKNP